VTPERQREIERICQAALPLGTPERDRFLVEACSGDDGLRGQVDSLLAQMSSFLETPAMVIAARQMGIVIDRGHPALDPTTLPKPVPGGGLFGPDARLAEHGPLDDARFSPGQIFASRHRIVSLIGRGAMG
jgi:hypothetical protein